MRIGAWTGRDGGVYDDNSAGVIRLAKACGLTVLDVMVNDGAKHGREFHTYRNERDTIDALSPIVDAGLELHITTWLQARPDWVRGMESVGRIALMTGAKGVTIEGEESWIASAQKVGRIAAAQAAKDAREALRGQFAGPASATHIIYPGSRTDVEILAAECDARIVQGYAVAKWFSKSSPGRAVDLAVKLWEPAGHVIGLAAYDLAGSYGGKTAEDVLWIDLQTAKARGFTEARYWRAESFRDPRMREALARAREHIGEAG